MMMMMMFDVDDDDDDDDEKLEFSSSGCDFLKDLSFV